MSNVLYTMMEDEKVKGVVKYVTGGDDCSAQHALVYLVGQLCGIEISESTISDDVNPNGLLGFKEKHSNYI